ncbi:hypothetical protein OG439_14320 [Amycolatopsis sp. NBC_01307]|uniref:hypothetical protein n=1 Tax=Amycolatopsis sp. NBC_01307 TaxID=2903561 RepID=UPI002E120970|nr:hypothetical protein OG439_14320 [Amycolatopsis sp. NBC_01307]
MIEDSLDDSVIINYPIDAILDSVRDVAVGETIGQSSSFILTRSGLYDAGELTSAGQALFKLRWVLGRKEDSLKELASALRRFNPIQVVEQELKGLGPVPESGVLDLLLQHRCVSIGTRIEDLRPFFSWMNQLKIIAYSKKMKTIRLLSVSADAPLAGEIDAIAAMISPKTPFLNVVRLRRIIRTLSGVVWWADPHFHVRALEELAEELEFERVVEIRILSGDSESVLTDRSMKDFRRFQKELDGVSIRSEWRVDSRKERDWHDRWLAGDKSTWNVPPINTLFKNDYSEIYHSNERPPLSEWWVRSVERS